MKRLTRFLIENETSAYTHVAVLNLVPDTGKTVRVAQADIDAALQMD